MVFSFSTKRTNDTEAIQRIKEHCSKKGLNFSAVVTNVLKLWEEQNVERSKVQSTV